MSIYNVHKAAAAVPLSGQIAGTPWEKAQVARIADYPWYSTGARQDTTVRALYDARSLYLQFQCQDAHSFSQVRQLNGPVCQDSCVEFFASLDPGRGPDYVNFECNCCGVMHVGFGPQRPGRRLIDESLAHHIHVASSIDSPTKAESPSDKAWWLTVEIPFTVLGELAGRAISPSVGTRWRGNFYRCGGKTEPQFASWNHVGTPGPDFHRPEYFGVIMFE